MGLLREGTEAKTVSTGELGMPELYNMMLWAGAQSTVLAHWQARHTRLKGFQHLIN